jgi:hypothetical protein
MAGDNADTSLGATISDLNAALDEAMWLGCLVSERRRAIRATFDALTLVAGGVGRSLLLRFWFGDLIVDDEAGGVVLDIAEFAADGRRWWDGLHSGDARTSGFGIHSLGPDGIHAHE